MARRIEGSVKRELSKLGFVVFVSISVASCAAGHAFRQGNDALKTGDLDVAVEYYRTATQADPDNPNYKIALQRTMLAASRSHFDKARDFENQGQLEAAEGEYRRAVEFDPTNRQAAAKVAALEQTLRARAEAARPRP